LRIARLTNLIKTYVEPEFTGYRQTGRLYYLEPINNILRAYYFGEGRGPDQLVVTAFVQPLYVPDVDLAFSNAYEVWSNEVTEIDQEYEMDQVLRRMKYYERFLLRHAEPVDLISGKSVFDPDYPVDESAHAREIRVYSQIAAGDYRGGRNAIASFRKFLKPKLDWTNPHPGPWLKEMDDRAAALDGALQNDPRIATQMLEKWTEQTRANLKLDG